MKKNTLLTTCMIALTMCLPFSTLTAADTQGKPADTAGAILSQAIPQSVLEQSALEGAKTTEAAQAAQEAYNNTPGTPEQKQAAANAATQRVLEEYSKNPSSIEQNPDDAAAAASAIGAEAIRAQIDAEPLSTPIPIPKSDDTAGTGSGAPSTDAAPSESFSPPPPADKPEPDPLLD